MPAFSERRFSLAIRPAGLSAPVLIFRPVLSRSRLLFSESLFFLSTRWAMSELTLVLMRVMGRSLRDGNGGRGGRDGTRSRSILVGPTRCCSVLSGRLSGPSFGPLARVLSGGSADEPAAHRRSPVC